MPDDNDPLTQPEDVARAVPPAPSLLFFISAAFSLEKGAGFIFSPSGWCRIQYHWRMPFDLPNQPRWYALALYTLGGIAVGASLAVILWL